MKKISEKILVLSVFLLTYYIYMNSIRKIMIPYSSITVPAILLLVLISTIICSNGKIKVLGIWDKLVCISWVIIAIYIFINNESLAKNIISGGLIQLYVMIAFLIFSNEKKSWIDIWLKSTFVFVMIHAISTIIFYFNSDLYTKFARLMFSGDELKNCFTYYRQGFMSGLSTHFSNNGMILSIGILIIWQSILYTRNSKNSNKTLLIFKYVCIVIVLYALILSSKRSPLLASFLAIISTYIICTGKNVWKSFIILIICFAILYGAYTFLADKIPGLSTIVNKTANLENSSAGILNGRKGLWQRAFDLFNMNPAFGKGYGSYASYANQTDAITTSAHNYYLQILAELGLFGMLLYLIVFGSGIMLAINLLKKSVNDKNLRNIMLASISLEIQIFVIVYCITATALMYYCILIQYILAITLAHVVNIDEYGNKKENKNENRNNNIYKYN